jgi:hypothetical protein
MQDCMWLLFHLQFNGYKCLFAVAVQEPIKVHEAVAKQQYINQQQLQYQQHYENLLRMKKLEEEAKLAHREAVRKQIEEERLRRKAQAAEVLK